MDSRFVGRHEVGDLLLGHVQTRLRAHVGTGSTDLHFIGARIHRVSIAPLVPGTQILRRRDRTPTITVRGDIAEDLQPPDVSSALLKQLQPIIEKLPSGYRIEQAGAIEESGKAGKAILPLLPSCSMHSGFPPTPMSS